WVMTPSIRFAGREPDPVHPRYLPVSPGFFETMQIRLFDGREFDVRDTGPSSTSVVVNQTFASHYFPGENALGKRFEKIGVHPDRQHAPARTFVGASRRFFCPGRNRPRSRRTIRSSELLGAKANQGNRNSDRTRRATVQSSAAGGFGFIPCNGLRPSMRNRR